MVSPNKIALITGVTGQDGAYLAEFLLQKGYEVHGIKRRTSLFNTDRIDHLYRDPHESGVTLKLHYGDLTDATNLIRVIQQVRPDEIYNLAAQSHVAVSFETPEYTANADALGTLAHHLQAKVLAAGAGHRHGVNASRPRLGRSHRGRGETGTRVDTPTLRGRGARHHRGLDRQDHPVTADRLHARGVPSLPSTMSKTAASSASPPLTPVKSACTRWRRSAGMRRNRKSCSLRGSPRT